MDVLSGVGGSCTSTARANKAAPRRDSSISLEEGACKRHTPEPVKSYQASQEYTSPEKPQESQDGCPLLPSEPSIPSSPLVAAPMDVYLQDEESHELRMMRLASVAPKRMSDQDGQTLEPKDISTSPDASSWEMVHEPRVLSSSPPAETRFGDRGEAPDTPALHPSLDYDSHPARTAASYIEVDDYLSAESDSDASERSLPAASQQDGDNAIVAKAEVPVASRQIKYVLPINLVVW
ncbi:hypothetical protein F66182_7094 [Fusarium sp. NRRL 66182]|nr:hypothetical protein F66182_7094 [Fusarium sp. NRRL 66182]